MKEVLARFRADPSHVRVGVRRLAPDSWEVIVEPRAYPVPHAPVTGCGPVIGSGRTAYRALARAIRAAWNAKIPGVDIYMEWAYPHPQGRKPKDRGR